MPTKFLLLIVLHITVLGTLVESIFDKCFSDKKQNCSEGNPGNVLWDSSVRFLLFTRKNPEEPEMLHMCNGELPENSNFNPNNKLYIFIPGYSFGVCELSEIPEVKDEWLKRGDFNVILIDCSEEYGSDPLGLVNKTNKVADLSVRVLKDIQLKTGFKNEDVTLVAHSLGCHTAGIIGQKFKVHRITALDPAGVVYFKETPLHQRLDAGDADLVDAIHTNGGKGIPYFGASFPLGDADFYVNGGSLQESCSANAWRGLKNLNLLYAIGITSVPSLCAHVLSIEYYKLTINSEHGKFIAWPCSSYKSFKKGKCTKPGATNVTMGFDFEDSFTSEERKKDFPRKYYLKTTSSWPYVSSSVITDKKEPEKVEEAFFFSYFFRS